MSKYNVKMSTGKSQIPEHPMLNGLVDLIKGSGDLFIAHNTEYVLLADQDNNVFYRFDKTEEGYVLAIQNNE